MRVFVTGASGWVGSAVLPELIGAGHTVIGLARSDEAAQVVSASGAEVQRGSLAEVDVLRQAAASADGVLHLAFRHDVAFAGGWETATQADRAAIEALSSALTGSDRPLIITSGTALLPPGRVVTEQDVADADHPMVARADNERLALSFAERGVRAVSLRLPPSVHGDGDQGFLAQLVERARAVGSAGYVGDGANRWPAVHRRDAARLFRMALTHAPAGSVLHAVGDEGVPTRAMAEVIARHLDVPSRTVAPGDAADRFGWLADLMTGDIPASSRHTRELLGWAPQHPGLLADLDAGHYFN